MIKIFVGGCMKDECLEERKALINFIKSLNTLGSYTYPVDISVLIEVVDPYDENWECKNIYKEIANMIDSDVVVFFKPGELSWKEIALLLSGKTKFDGEIVVMDSFTNTMKKYLEIVIDSVRLDRRTFDKIYLGE